MRKIRLLFVSILTMFCFSLAAQEAQAACNIETVLTVDGEMSYLMENCYVTSSFMLPNKLNGNGYKIIAVNPPSGRFLGPIVFRDAGDDVELINVKVDTDGLQSGGRCINAGSNRLVGMFFGNMVSVTIKGGDVKNVNFGSNVQCDEGFGVRIVNSNLMATKADIKNFSIDKYQRIGLMVLNHVEMNFDNSEIGECSNQAVQACTTVQVSGANTLQPKFTSNNSKFAQNSNKSGYQNVHGVGFLLAAVDTCTTIRNFQMKEGNAETAVYIAPGTWCVTLDNPKISETGDDGPFSTDIAIRDLGLGVTLLNLENMDAKIRGYDIPIYRAIPIVDDLRSASITAVSGDFNEEEVRILP